jgi:8-oxo-dGTP pyrophosphatase MutT (NUDIX family)
MESDKVNDRRNDSNDDPGAAAWTRLSTRELYRTRVLSLMGETLRCERTGACDEFVTFRCPDWVNAIAVAKDGRVVVIRQYRFGSRRTQVEVPGGCIDSTDSDPVSAGARELLEETGYRGVDGRIIGAVNPNPALQGNRCFTVKFVDAEKVSEPRLERTEDIETFLASDAELKAMIRSGELDHGLMIDALTVHWLDEKAL